MAPPKLELHKVVNDSVVSCIDPKRAALSLWKQNSSNLKAFGKEILQLCLELVSQPKDALDWDKAASFLQHLCGALEGQPEAWGNCMEEVLHHLKDYTYLLDATQRQRLIQLVYHVLQGFANADVGLDSDLLDDLTIKMQERLTDKVYPVRKLAAQALKHLAVPSEDGYADESTVKMLERLDEEPHQDVRAAILRAAALTYQSLQAFIQRTQDVSPVVRKEAYSRIACVGPATLSDEPGGAAGLVWRGVRDRAPEVKQAAIEMVKIWLDACRSDVHDLLDQLHVTQHPDVCHVMLDELCEAGHITLKQLLAEVPGGGLRSGAASLTAAQAFTRAHACLRLQVQGADLGQKAAATSGAAATIVAADATRALDLLESVLPESAQDMVSLITGLVQAGPSSRFAALQMMRLATNCMDWADGSNREQGVQFLKDVLLAIDPSRETELPTESMSGGCAWALAGCHGTGGWEDAVVSLATRLLPLQPSGDTFTACVLGRLQELGKMWGMDQSTGGHPACHLQLLAYMDHVLAVLQAHSMWPTCLDVTSASAGRQDQMAASQDSAATTWLLNHVIQPGLMSSADVHVQCAALRVVGRLSTTASVPRTITGSLAKQALLPQLAGACVAILQQPDANAQLTVQAVTTLCDAMLLHGVPTIKGAACEAHAAAQLSSAPTDADDTNDLRDLTLRLAATNLDCKDSAHTAPDVVQCLVNLLSRAFLDPEKPLSSKKRRKGSAGDGQLQVPAEVLGAAVEGGCKLLMMQDFHTALATQWNRAMALQEDEVTELLKHLLICHVHPLTSSAPGAQQCLVEFLKCYSKKPSGKHHLVHALIYASRAALRIPLTSDRKTGASPLTKHIRHLLLADLGTPAGESQGPKRRGLSLSWVDELVVMVGAELKHQVCRQGKEQVGWEDYLKELAALLVAVPLDPSSPLYGTILHISQRGLHDCLKQPKTALGVTLARSLKAARDHVDELAGQVAVEAVTPEEVARVMQGVNKHMPPVESAAPAVAVRPSRGRRAKSETGSDDDQDVDERDQDEAGSEEGSEEDV